MSKKFKDKLKTLNINELEDLQKKIELIDLKSFNRLQFLIMVNKNPNLSYLEIASKLSVDRKTLNRWSSIYMNGGIEKLIGDENLLINELSIDACVCIKKWINSGNFIHYSIEDLVDDLLFALKKEYPIKLISNIVTMAVNNECKICGVTMDEFKSNIKKKNYQKSRSLNRETIKNSAEKILKNKKII